MSRSANRVKSITIAVLASLLFWQTSTSAYAEDPDRLIALKAAYIFNIARFTYWAGDDPNKRELVLCLTPAAAHYRSAFLSLESKRKGKGRLRVRQLTDPSGLPGCDILYLAGSLKPRATRLALGQAGLLTVADENLQLAGSIIEFSVVENRLRFSVDLGAADDAGLKMSSKLLTLAYEVRRSTSTPRPSS